MVSMVGSDRSIDRGGQPSALIWINARWCAVLHYPLVRLAVIDSPSPLS